MTCKVLHTGGLSEGVSVNTGVRRGCLMALLLFLLAMDWIMKETARDLHLQNGIKWTFCQQWDNVEFPDDISLLCRSDQQKRDKTTLLTANSIELVRLGIATQRKTQKLQGFINKCLRGILNIRWTYTVTGLKPIQTQILKWKWRWISHTSRKPVNNIARQVLRWNHLGKRKRRSPENSRCREVEAEMRRWGHLWLDNIRKACPGQSRMERRSLQWPLIHSELRG